MSSVGATRPAAANENQRASRWSFVDAGPLNQDDNKVLGNIKKYKWNDLVRVGMRNWSEDRTRTGTGTGRVKIGGFGIFAPYEEKTAIRSSSIGPK